MGPQPAWPLLPPVDPRGPPEGVSLPCAGLCSDLYRPSLAEGWAPGRLRTLCAQKRGPRRRRWTRMQGWLSQTCDLSLAF